MNGHMRRMHANTHTLLQNAVCVAQRIINIGHIAESKCDRVGVLRIGCDGQALGVALDKLERVLDQIACRLPDHSLTQSKNEKSKG